MTPKFIVTCCRLLSLKRGSLLLSVRCDNAAFIVSTAREVVAQYESVGVAMSLGELVEKISLWWRRFDGRLSKSQAASHVKRKERAKSKSLEKAKSTKREEHEA